MNGPGASGPAVGSQPKPIPAGRPRVAAAEAATAPRTARSGLDRRAVPIALAPPASDPTHVVRAAKLLSSPPRDTDSTLLAQAVYVRGTLLGSNLVAAVVCVVFGVMWGLPGWDDALLPWWVAGALAIVLGLGLQLRYPRTAMRGMTDRQASRFLGLVTITAFVSGLMMAWGWAIRITAGPSDGREAFLLAQFGMILWSLYALRPCLPALLGFVLTSMASAFAASAGVLGSPADLSGAAAGLAILTLFVVGFAIHSAREVNAALRLQDRVQRLLEEVTATRDEAVKATQAKSRFLASVSHDLRQPMHAMNLYLTAVTGQFERFRAAPGDGASARGIQEGLRSLRESMLYLNSMFESLLDISRLNAGNVAVDIRHTTLTGMLAQLESDYSRQAATQGLRFEMRLPVQIALIEVETDPALLERLLRNLLVNAFRYTRSGGVRLALRVQGRSLDFRVIDTGPGIESSMRTRVFEEFFQVPDSQPVSRTASASGRDDETSSATGSEDEDRSSSQVAGRGIGLGLSISARLADTLGSRIRLHSHLGHGSVFAFRQPIRIALRPGAEARAASRERVVELPQGLFVAVIDDDPEIRRATRQMLEVLGVEVFTADSGSRAVAQLGRLGRMPDLLISDFRLVAETGVQCIAMLREEFNHEIPALLITGDTSPEHLAEFRRLGLTVLYKPVSAARLLSAAREELHRAEASRS